MSHAKHYRFLRKSYGRGRTPASRQGWSILGLYIALVVSRGVLYSRMAQSDYQQRAGTELEPMAGGNLVVFLLPIVLMTTILILICYKTGESPKRQRGPKK